MVDILIRDVPEDVVASLEAAASRLGLSRSEYVRRRWAQEASRLLTEVAVSDLQSFEATFADLDDPQVMSQAWR